MAVGNKSSNYRRHNKNQSQKRWNDNKSTNPRSEQKPCTRCGKSFGSGHLKNCPAMGKTCKNCYQQKRFAKMGRSNQVNEIGEDKSSSEEECNLIQSFDSCEEFETMVLEPRAERPLKKGVGRMKSKMNEENRISTTQGIKKIDIFGETQDRVK